MIDLYSTTQVVSRLHATVLGKNIGLERVLKVRDEKLANLLKSLDF